MLPVGFANLAKMFLLSDDSPFSILEDSPSLHRYILSEIGRITADVFSDHDESAVVEAFVAFCFFLLRCLRALLVNTGQETETETDPARYCKYKFCNNLVMRKAEYRTNPRRELSCKWHAVYLVFFLSGMYEFQL